ncbi:integrin beta-3-like [Saccostrea echinata]|uniref:integrin beta-3-like n=1 Tax=Saccostrea echinata TaxID=191078 RepID=UPI002A82B221|nr:integrin beta-3-like [Saccostrea echinata]
MTGSGGFDFVDKGEASYCSMRFQHFVGSVNSCVSSYHENNDIDYTYSECLGSRCGECLIRDSCAWCKDRNFTKSRCGEEIRLKQDNCRNIVRRQNHTIDLVKDNDFSDGGKKQDAVQIKPQHVKIKLVPNTPLKDFYVNYKVAKNFPLDLYFLNEPSKTMMTLKNTLKSLTKTIAKEIDDENNTDIQYGLGTAMDKQLLPFTRIHQLTTDTCEGSNNQFKCEKPYSYHHLQKLTKNTTEFENAVDEIIATTNFDKPNGMLDGLIQAMVCGDKIGWRKKARRMLFYSTDATFHHAGDGRLAGIVDPNDGICHLDSSGFYRMSELQDYPSLGQVIQKAKENNINIVFVIGGNFSEVTKQDLARLYYDTLTATLPGGIQSASKLWRNASNILDIVVDNYKKVRGVVKLVVNEEFEELNVTMYTTCRTDGRHWTKTNICFGLNPHKEAHFLPYVHATFEKCPENEKLNFTIFPEGLEERVFVELEHVCRCECELEPEAEPKSSKCNYHGTFECGSCNCDSGWIGDSCECDNRGTEDEKCGTEKGICNGAGQCTCRKCECFKGYSGEKCECNDENCRTYNKLLCGGPERGRCACGACVCNANYSGEACDCLQSEEPCKSNNGTICSGNGFCECGHCICNTGFRGKLCNSCTHCPGICSNNKDCAECMAFNQGLYNSTVCKQRCYNVETASFLQPRTTENQNDLVTIKSCIIEDAFGCFINFNVYDSDEGRKVVVKETKRCPAGPPNLLLVGLSIAGTILLIGLILLIIWKLLTLLYDHVEFSKFETEIMNPAWEKSENPIYKECVTKIDNPMCDSGFNPDENDEKILIHEMEVDTASSETQCPEKTVDTSDE